MSEVPDSSSAIIPVESIVGGRTISGNLTRKDVVIGRKDGPLPSSVLSDSYLNRAIPEVVEGEYVQEKGKGAPKSTTPPQEVSGGFSVVENDENDEFKEPSWLIGTKDEYLKLRTGKLGTVGKRIAMLHASRIVDILNVDDLAEKTKRLGEEAVDEGINDTGVEVWVDVLPYLAKMTDRVKEMEDQKTPVDPGKEKDEGFLREIANELKKIQEGAAKGQGNEGSGENEIAQGDIGETIGNAVAHGMAGLEALQFQQLELMRRSGFSGLISAMDNQAAINVQQFDTEPPVWYDKLTPEWKNIIRLNLGVLLGSYYKTKSEKGPEAIISSKDIVITKEILDDVWAKMPGFQEAMATMTQELFDQSTQFIQLSNEGRERLGEYRKYKEDLIYRISNYLSLPENEDKLNPKLNGGGPENLSAEQASRFAVSAVWNLLFLGGTPESGDTIHPAAVLDFENKHVMPDGTESKGRQMVNMQTFSPAIRSFYLPRDQAKSKYVQGEEDLFGTDEGWGGRTGDWFSEEIRHNPDFKQQFLRNEGITQILPYRFMYSMLDLTYFDSKKIDDMRDVLPTDVKNISEDEVKLRPITMTDVLVRTGKTPVSIQTKEGRSVVWKYKNAEKISFRNLKSGEIWGGYANYMDSAWKIYQAWIGRGDDKFDAQSLGTALSVLRKDPNLKSIYTGYSGEMLLTGIIAGLAGGPIQFIPEVVLNLPEDKYDTIVHTLLRDDRVLAGLPSGARQRILQRLNANDQLTFSGVFGSIFSESPIFGKRKRLRVASGMNQEKYLKGK